MCTLHSAAPKDAEQDPLFRATPRAPQCGALFFSDSRCFFHRSRLFFSSVAADFTSFLSLFSWCIAMLQVSQHCNTPNLSLLKGTRR